MSTWGLVNQNLREGGQESVLFICIFLNINLWESCFYFHVLPKHLLTYYLALLNITKTISTSVLVQQLLCKLVRGPDVYFSLFMRPASHSACLFILGRWAFLKLWSWILICFIWGIFNVEINRRAYFHESNFNFRYEKVKTNAFCRMTISSVICSFI